MRRWFFAALCLVLLCVACAASASGALGAGARGDTVKEMQERLQALNYLSDKPDGVFGEHTAAAVAAFQQAHGLPATGTADEDTLAALYDDSAEPAPRALARGDKGKGVAALQERLIFYGFLTGKADGEFGPATQTAVSAFQKHLAAQGLGVKATGKADLETQSLLSAPEYEVYLADVAAGSDGDAIKRLQRRLIALNYMEGEPDGDFGTYTEDAVKAFQGACGLTPDGVADRATFRALYKTDAEAAPRPVLRALNKGDSGASVQLIQQRLIEMGMLGGVALSRYDDAMASALARLREHLLAFDLDWAADWPSTGPLEADLQRHILDDALPVYRKDVASGTKGDQATRVQRRLNALAYLIHTNIDGAFGKNSVAALEEFQTLNGLEPTGKADEPTQAVLFSPDAVSKKTEWMLRVSRNDQTVYAYRLDGRGEYRLERTMPCSTGTQDRYTPSGVFLKTGPQDRWHYFSKFYCWAQYTYYIDGDVMFHSVLYSSRSESSLRHSSVSMLGRRASHGCVRLAVEDARFIFETCPAGTIVIVE